MGYGLKQWSKFSSFKNSVFIQSSKEVPIFHQFFVSLPSLLMTKLPPQIKGRKNSWGFVFGYQTHQIYINRATISVILLREKLNTAYFGESSYGEEQQHVKERRRIL